MTTVEEWRPVVGFETHYEVSSLGRMRSLTRLYVDSTGVRRTKVGKVLRPNPNSQGYPTIQLSVDNHIQHRVLHRLVAAAFIGPRPDGLMVCHNNGDKTDARLSNLRYDTASSNAFDMLRHGTHYQARKTHCPRGHEFTPENTRHYAGRRFCKECRRLRTQRAAAARVSSRNYQGEHA